MTMMRPPMMLIACSLLSTLTACVDAFSVPPAHGLLAPALSQIHDHGLPTIFDNQQQSAGDQLSSVASPTILSDHAASFSSLLLLADNAILDVLRNVAVAITAILFLLAGLTYVTAAVIVPAAAKELEKECLELAPELWREYLQKLEPGQTMAQRPDLMQELGIKLQPLMDAKVARMEAGKGTAPPQPEQAVTPTVVDVDVEPSYEVVVEEPSISLSTMSGQWDDDEEEEAKTKDKKP